MPSKRDRLRQVRRSAGLTQEELAHRLQVDRGTVVRWESGANEPSAWLQPKLAKLLGVTRADLVKLLESRATEAKLLSQRHEEPRTPAAAGTVADALRPLREPLTATDGGPIALSADLAELRGWIEEMKRRELIKALGSSAVVVAASALGTELNLDEHERVVETLAAPGRVDEPVIGHIEDVLWSVMRQDDSLGPHAVLGTVLAQRQLVETILPECPSTLRPRLLSLFANISGFVGWVLFDLNNFDAAQYYYEQARVAAHEAENVELGIMCLCYMAHLSIWRGQPRVGIDYALAAQGWASAIDDVPLRCYVADISARAFSADGNRRACMDALDRVHSRLATVQTPCAPAASLAYFYNQSDDAGTRSECFLNLNEAKAAADAATEALILIDRSFVRNHAFSTIFLGEACIGLKEIDQAAEAVGNSAELVARNRSARLVQRLRRSRNLLSPWRDTIAVKALDERLGAHGFRQVL